LRYRASGCLNHTFSCIDRRGRRGSSLSEGETFSAITPNSEQRFTPHSALTYTLWTARGHVKIRTVKYVSGHFWLTPKSGGKVDYERPTQVGRAMKELGVHMIAAYSPQARGRSERNLSTWQGRLPQEFAIARDPNPGSGQRLSQ
jgi:hypothetical protein